MIATMSAYAYKSHLALPCPAASLVKRSECLLPHLHAKVQPGSRHADLVGTVVLANFLLAMGVP